MPRELQRLRLPLVIATTLVSAWPLRARTEEASDREAISVTVDAPPDCPTREAFLRSVLGRTGKIRIVGAADASRRFTLQLFEADGAFVGKLTSVDAVGATSERKLDASRCTEVSDGLALVLALAVDPDATVKVTREVQTADLGESSVAPTVMPTPTTSPQPQPKRQPPAAVSTELVKETDRPWRFTGRALATTGLSVWREPLLGARAGLAVDSPELGALGAVFTLDVDYQQTVGVEIQTVPVVMRFAKGVAQLCPLRVRAVTRLDLGACLVTEAGVLLGEGLVRNETILRTWGGIGHGISARYWPTHLLGFVLELQQIVVLNRPPVIQLGTDREVLESRWTTYSLAIGVTGLDL